MALTIVTEPAAEPIDAEEAREHLRLDLTLEDALLDGLITAARRKVEELTARGLMTQTWELRLDSFPTTIYVPLSPLDATAPITSIKYVDTEGVEQTLAAANYTVDRYSEPGRIVPAYGLSWPSTRAVPNAVTVQFKVGYGEADDVPEAIKLAIKQLLAHWYENREPVSIGSAAIAEIPLTMAALLSPYMRPTL